MRRFRLAGGRVTNFTSGQGLILMKEVLYVIAGKRLPVVFHIGARAITSQSLNIHCGHDDVMGVADCGWGMLFGRNAQEAADLALIARRAAEYCETPFFNVQDGFLTTHTLESVRLPEPELMLRFIQHPERLRNLFDPQHPMQSGVVQNQDSYMKGRIAQRFFYDRVKPSIRAAMEEYTTLTGRQYDLIRCYRMEDAEYAFVGLGSMMETAQGAVDFLREKGMRIGVISVTSFRPFPGPEIAAALRHCTAAVVIERTDVPLAQSNPLLSEVKAALADAAAAGEIEVIPELYGAVAGLGGNDIRPGHFVSLAHKLDHGGRSLSFLGIKHLDAIDMAEDPDVRPKGAFSLRGHSVGRLWIRHDQQGNRQRGGGFIRVACAGILKIRLGKERSAHELLLNAGARTGAAPCGAEHCRICGHSESAGVLQRRSTAGTRCRRNDLHAIRLAA